ncbi:MAG: tetratricopeptide repeat protein [Elusimicrobia bacterium]|nr:tetratricopeptide repeat protein [Elusimicrobiota bacterium]
MGLEPRNAAVRRRLPSLIGALILLSCVQARASTIDSPLVQTALSDGIKNLYDLEYEASRGDFRKLIESEPDNPLGYLFESAQIWWQSSAEYGLFKGTPTLQGLFEQDIEFALKKAKPLLKAKDDAVETDGHFVTGMALGTKGMWNILRWNWLAACVEGKKALGHLKDTIKADPEYYDAYLGLGIFDYQAAHLPAVVKPVALLCGARGNEKRGLERMQLAMEKGRYLRRQAAQFMASIYIIDQQDYARALTLIHGLRADYPDSPYFKYLEAVIKFRLGDWSGSLPLVKELSAAFQADPPRFQRKLLTFVCSLSGKDCLCRQDVELAFKFFNYAVENLKPDDPPEWAAMARLYRGHAADMLGKRKDAEADYRWVLDHPAFLDGHLRAADCLKKRCNSDRNLRYLQALSKGEEYRPQDEPGPKPAGGQ